MKHNRAILTKLLTLLLCLGLAAQAGGVACAQALAEALPEEVETVSAEAGEAEAEEVPDVDDEGFWDEFHEEYAEDAEYLKWFEIYSQEDSSLNRSGELSEEELEELASSGKNPYTGLTYTHASVHSGKKVVYGIDVSYFQGTIDWSKVKAAGIEYVFIRCGRSLVKTGEIGKDVKMDTYIPGAYKAGLKVGVYYFSQALTVAEAQKEAKKTLEYIKPYKSMISLPVAMDVESGSGYRINKVSRAQGTKNVKAYCKIIEDAGYDAYYYGNPNDLADLCDVSQLGDYGCWLARYNTSTTYSNPYDFWQYSSTGKVKGIGSTYVDCNFWYVGTDTVTVNESPDGSQSEKKEPEQLSAPTLVSAVSVNGGVRITWLKVSGAEKYRVFRKVDGGSWKKMGDTANLTYLNRSAESGKTYTYTVRCVTADGTDYASGYDETGKTVTYIAAPAISKVQSVSGGVKVTWGAVSGAKKYRVFRKTSTGSWKKLADTTSLTYQDKGAVNGARNVYTVRCVTADGTGYASGYDPDGKSAWYLAVPTLTSVTNSKKGAFTATWKKNAAATGYQLRYQLGSATKTKTVKGAAKLSKTVTALTKGKTYQVSVRTYKSVDGKKVYSAWSATKKVKIAK